eukprot:IDg7126t1
MKPTSRSTLVVIFEGGDDWLCDFAITLINESSGCSSFNSGSLKAFKRRAGLWEYPGAAQRVKKMLNCEVELS